MQMSMEGDPITELTFMPSLNAWRCERNDAVGFGHCLARMRRDGIPRGPKVSLAKGGETRF